MANAIAISKENGKFQGALETPEELVVEGNPKSVSWLSHKLDVSGKAKMGIWSGEPGKINIPFYPYNEMFTVLFGKIEKTNEDGSIVVVGPGQSGFLPKGWKGVWHVVEPSEKCYFTID